jgi:hypothetical protein
MSGVRRRAAAMAAAAAVVDGRQLPCAAAAGRRRRRRPRRAWPEGVSDMLLASAISRPSSEAQEAAISARCERSSACTLCAAPPPWDRSAARTAGGSALPLAARTHCSDRRPPAAAAAAEARTVDWLPSAPDALRRGGGRRRRVSARGAQGDGEACAAQWTRHGVRTWRRPGSARAPATGRPRLCASFLLFWALPRRPRRVGQAGPARAAAAAHSAGRGRRRTRGGAGGGSDGRRPASDEPAAAYAPTAACGWGGIVARTMRRARAAG